MRSADKEHKPLISETAKKSRANLDVRKLKLRYSRRTPGKVKLVIEYVGGRLKVFEVDRFLIERRYTYASKVSCGVTEDRIAGNVREHRIY